MADDVGVLFQSLNRRQVPDEIRLKFSKLGPSGYEKLTKAVRAGDLSDRQTANAIHILVWLRANGDLIELCDLLGQLTCSRAVNVRTTATVSLIGLIKLYEEFPSTCKVYPKRSSYAPLIRKALQEGLLKGSQDFVRAFLQEL